MLNKILIIEDELPLQYILEHLLEKENYKVDVASDGKGALNMLVRFKYSLILMDLMLPFVSGFELIGKIRSDKRNAETPIIVLSASSSEDTIAGALAVGANDFLKKPFALDALLSKVGHFVGQEVNEGGAI